MQRSLQEWDGEAVTISYKPFFLDPTIPPEGYDFLEYMQRKGGGRIPPERFFEGPRQMGLQAGIIFNFLDIPKAPNTALAHTLIALTPVERQADMVEALYDAFFQYGQDVGDLDTLLTLAEKLELDRESMRAGLVDPKVRAKVEAEVQDAYRMGIAGVPFFVINRKYAFSGAQPPEVILGVFKQISAKV